MFTGIVQAIGRIEGLMSQSQVLSHPASPYSDAQGLRVHLLWGDLDPSDIAEGDSIAVNGACMTAIAPTDQGCFFDISRESLNRTVGLDKPGPVHLEKALRASDRLGGHIVSGHVDGTARVTGLRSRDESHELLLEVPSSLAMFVTEKGSVSVHGVSLTVNAVSDLNGQTEISINLIPHTWKKTIFSQLAVGDRLNLEVDPLARQVARVLESLINSGRWPTAAGHTLASASSPGSDIPVQGPRA
ncbi:MAG: riboflavin synthase [Burkholderiaceae bacterium]